MKGIRKCTSCMWCRGKPGKYIKCAKRNARVDVTFGYICEYYEQRWEV